ncbi:MAG: hypothetical protein BZ136_00895 [Methanosphaera sp. rholeuAM74]|nr:MAG: hypothetical protein BZ136_00895 [Methanosphaera sp. rholeuAM74]
MKLLPWGTRQKLSNEEFFNRKIELSNIKNQLYSTVESNPPEMLLTGVRGVGKTVFLNKIKADLTDEGYLVILIDFSTAEAYQRKKLSVKGIIQHYYDELVTQATEKNIYNIQNRIKKYFTTHNFKVKDYKTIERIPLPIIGSEDDLRHLTKFVLNLPQKIYEDNPDKIKGVIVIIDEFQIIKEMDDYLDSFLWVFRGHIQNHNNVAYMLSGSMSLNDPFIQDVAGQKGVFGGRMLTHYLYPFNKETTKTYLREKAPQYIFTEESFDRFYKCTKGVPYYINTLANHLPQNITLTPEDVIETFDNNLFSMIKSLIAIWINLSNMEKDIIIALIEQPLQRKDIANKLNVESGTLSKYLTKLIQLDLISNNQGTYSIHEDMLKRWLKMEYEDKKVYPYRF